MLKKISVFKYFEPSTMIEALDILEQYQEKAKLLAGGTDLLIAMKNKDLYPECVVNLKSFGEKEFNYIKLDNNKNLHIGALTKISEIENSSLVQEYFPILSQAANAIGSLQIRNLATIGGNICNASPAADTIPALLVMDASVYVIGKEKKRKINIKDLFISPGQTVLRNEVLTEIEIPKISENYHLRYINKGPRKAMDISQVVVAVAVELSHKMGVIKNARIGIGGVYATPKRCMKSEKYLTGKNLDEKSIKEVAEILCSEISPISDVRGSDWYKLTLAKTLLIQELENIVGGK